MDLSKVVSILDEEFDVTNVKDDWSWQFDRLFIKKSVASFRKSMHNTGLLIKNSNEVKKIYAAFSPSRYVLEEIQMRGIVNVLLVVKHPFDWDGRRNGQGFLYFKERDYQLMEGMGISIYSLHTPLDKNRNDDVVSTAYAFAKVIKLNVRKVTEELGKVAIVTGGGLIPRLIEQAKDKGVTTYVTGIITPNSGEYSKKNYKKTLNEVNKIGINIIGCSHYLTEKWAMQYSIPYFSKICKAEFIEDKEALNLLE